LFAGLDAAAIADLAEYMTSFEAPAGQVLVEIGQPGSGLFVIQDGEPRWSSPGRR
jgi:CRP-like cAMP-binding protein